MSNKDKQEAQEGDDEFPCARRRLSLPIYGRSMALSSPFNNSYFCAPSGFDLRKRRVRRRTGRDGPEQTVAPTSGHSSGAGALSKHAHNKPPPGPGEEPSDRNWPNKGSLRATIQTSLGLLVCQARLLPGLWRRRRRQHARPTGASAKGFSGRPGGPAGRRPERARLRHPGRAGAPAQPGRPR